MKSINISTVLQIVALIFLIIIGYMTFNSSENWKVITSELEKANKELKISKDTLAITKNLLKNSRIEFKQMKAQKDLLIHQRDSILFAFKKKNAKDWNELQNIKDSIQQTNNQLTKDRVLLEGLFGLNQ
ncbi:hypothetical protein [uncultured Aquimarina sp.]|uniref:hypothetical protein n=1 Tax=uncultured Aquimarina sp. TaxID=575652 RepID=UPI002636F645|nr:hypothetical protein [uncultured Aquimarina sp.]